MAAYNSEELFAVAPRRAFAVGVRLGPQPEHEVEEHLEELERLIASVGGKVLGRAIQRRQKIDRATFIGSGKAEEIAAEAKEAGAEVLVFDDDLSASQVKNLEKVGELAVMDRSSLILEIFNRRARSREARTQVELARLQYLLPRLTRRWEHLSRQVGGIGVRGGEGESQLEADRRMLRRQISRLKKQLQKIEKTRKVQRQGRSGIPTVALAGYTNAGKSTLFNTLTGAGVRAEDRLFATLDSRLRRGALDAENMVIFADTVGFIRKLPHHLVSSFRSTLEEIVDADLVLHVVDRSHPAWRDQLEVAEQVLEELGVEQGRILTVFNKRDLLPGPAASAPGGDAEAVWISAATGAGLDELKGAIRRRVYPHAKPPFHGEPPLPDAVSEERPTPAEEPAVALPSAR